MTTHDTEEPDVKATEREDALKLALACAGTVLRFRAYTPGPMLVMLTGRFRDDLREVLDLDRLTPAYRAQ